MMILFFDKFNSSDFLSLNKPSASMFFSLSIPPQLFLFKCLSSKSALCAASAVAILKIFNALKF